MAQVIIDEATSRFAAALEDARGGLSFKKLERALWQRLGDYAPTDETLRRYHRGDIHPTKADLVIVLTIAQVYDVAASSLSPVIAGRLEEMRELVASSRWCSAFPGQGRFLFAYDAA